MATPRATRGGQNHTQVVRIFPKYSGAAVVGTKVYFAPYTQNNVGVCNDCHRGTLGTSAAPSFIPNSSLLWLAATVAATIKAALFN